MMNCAHHKMYLNKQRCLFTVLVALWWQKVPVCGADCIHPDLASCTTGYTRSLTGSAITNKDQYCRVIRDYYSCIVDICDKIPQDMMDFIVDAQTHYFDCGITSASTRLMPSALLHLWMSALLSTLLLR